VRGSERCQGQDHRHRFHLLAGLAIEIDGTRLGVGNRLSARGRGAHPVELTIVHRRED
jgi:DNA topoisomerase IB